MSLWRQLTRGVRALIRPAAADQDVADEVADYLDRRTAELVARGLDPASARRTARLEAGNPTAMKEAVLDARWERGLAIVLAELAHAARMLARRPGYAAVVVGTLGLGIGATATVYTVVDALLVRPLPYPDAERLMVLGNTRDGVARLEPMSFPNVQDLSARAPGVLDRVAAVERNSWVVSDRSQSRADVVQIAAVSRDFFALVGARPALGRTFDSTSGDGVTLLSYRAWQTRFGGDPDIVGKVTPGGVTLTVTGVLPRDFHPPAALAGADVEFWIPLDPANRRYQDRLRRNVRTLALLAPGVTLEQARRDVSAAQSRLASEFPEGNTVEGRALGAGLNPLRDETLGGAARPVLLLLGAAALLLLLAGTNAANLLLVRGLERTAELSLRRAIGAGRGRLTVGLLAESVLLAFSAGVLGLALAYAGVTLFRHFGPALPHVHEIGVNGRIVLAGVVFSILVGVGVGLVPALRAGNPDLLSTLRSSVHAATIPGTRLRASLAAVQLSLACVLAVGATLLLRSFVQLSGARLGFEPSGLTAFMVPLKSPHLREDWDRLSEQLAALPGVTHVAIASSLPLQAPSWRPRVQSADEPASSPAATIAGYTVTPSYFATLGIPVRRGRAFDSRDRPESPSVAIVNETLAQSTLRGRDPVGARIRVIDDGGPGAEFEIVGVVGDVVQERVEDGVAPAIYVSYTQSFAIPNVVVRRERTILEAGEVQRALAATGLPPLPVLQLASMPTRIATAQAGQRFQMLLITGFAATALLLAAIGLYGTLAFTVRSRTRELGIRLALGAAPMQIRQLVLRQGMLVFAAGAALGLGGALALSRVLQGILYRLSPLDPVSFAIALAVVGAAGLLAAWRPAGRAARIDPMRSIRVEG